jgi:AcrR family transcriptional regulator
MVRSYSLWPTKDTGQSRFASRLLTRLCHLFYRSLMSRPVDESLPDELRKAIIQYLIRHGLTGLSLRPLAKALGCTPRVLLYHFGSKEKLLVDVLAHIRQQQSATYEPLEAGNLTEACQNTWKHMSAPDSEPLFRLFFEAYGIALRYPQRYEAFLHGTIEHWLGLISGYLQGGGYERNEARAVATVVLAGLRGFMLDFCTTHDRKRLDRAVALWLRSVESTLTTRKEVSRT